MKVLRNDGPTDEGHSYNPPSVNRGGGLTKSLYKTMMGSLDSPAFLVYHIVNKQFYN